VKRVWVLVLAALVLSGCGGGGRRTVTIPRYDIYPPETVTGSTSPAECARDARIFARDALAYLAHIGTAYPSDLNYVILRGDFSDFQARRCDPKLLGVSLRRRLTPAQRAELVARLPSTIAEVVRDGLARK
jgi:hypothetical protein